MTNTMTPVGPMVERQWGNDPGDFVCRATPYSHHMDFKVYEILWVDADGMAYDKRTDKYGSPAPTLRLDEAGAYFAGSVKWDGCCNVQFVEDSNVMLHFCGKSHLQRVHEMMIKVYDLAAEIIPEWQD